MSTVNEELVRNALRTVMDPELGANIVDLNMVRNVVIDQSKVKVDLVLTTPECPLAGWIVLNARRAIERLPGVQKLEIEVLDEPWEPPYANDWRRW